MSSFLQSYCKIVCMCYSLHMELNVMVSLKMNCAVGKTKLEVLIKFHSLYLVTKWNQLK